MKSFFANYVHGTGEIDYNAILRNAGWKLDEVKAADGVRSQFRIVDLESISEAQRTVRNSLLGAK
jgi:hypothetical protein